MKGAQTQRVTFDTEYLRRLQARDPASERRFVSYFGKGLQIKLRGWGFASAVLEDISLETFYRVLIAVRNGTVLHPERFSAYVKSVCDQVILEKYPEHSRGQDLVGSDSPLPPRRLRPEDGVI